MPCNKVLLLVLTKQLHSAGQENEVNLFNLTFETSHTSCSCGVLFNALWFNCVCSE